MRVKQKIYINLTIFAVIFLLLLVFALPPQIEKLKKGSEELTLAKKNLQTLKSQVNSSNTFQENYSLYQPTLLKIEQSFVDLQSPIAFVEFLESQAQELSLDIKISPWQSIGFQVSIGGPFPDSLKFLEKLENSPFLLEIMQTNIERIGEKSRRKDFEGLAEGDVILTMAIKTFDGD